MTPFPPFRRLGVAVAASLATAAVFTAALWIQHARVAWPFAPARATAPSTNPGMSSGTSATSTHDRVPVDLDPEAAGDLDIRVEAVRRESLTQSVRAVATVVPDESSISHVHTRIAGWIEQLDVNTTGEVVVAGQPLARVFSQELLSSQTEYLAARKNTAASGIASAVIAGGRTRLTVLGMTPAEIDAIEQTGEPKRLVTIVAPRSGVVVNRGISVGTSVDPSTTLLTIADLSRVWVIAEVPEASIVGMRAGAIAQLDFPASGRPPFSARIDFLYPTLTERTRTLRVRLTAANASGALRPGLYGTASFETAGPEVITVSRNAIVDTGAQQHVFVTTGGRFEPRVVTLGVQLTDRVEVRSGLMEGEQIVSSGVFLLDSESRLRATGGTGGHNHSGSTSAGEPKAPATDPHAGHTTTPAIDPHAGHPK